MFGLKSVYFYLIACQITLIKLFKKIYFSSKNYNKSLETVIPQQVYHSPNPFLLSIIKTYKKQSFKINEIDPNIFWLEDNKNSSKEMHNFSWLTLLDRKTDNRKIKKIIFIWMLKNSKYKRSIWDTSTLSTRVISWILNIDFILNNSTFDFRNNFISCIIRQTNHLKKNIKFEKNYVKKMIASFQESIKLSSPVKKVKRSSDNIEVFYGKHSSHSDIFDKVIFSNHSDQALQILESPTNAESEILGSIKYQKNKAILHYDHSILPNRKRAWSSWNYLLDQDKSKPVSLTYNMNILQGIDAPETFCVTLNDTASINPHRILGRFNYAHPQFTLAGMKAQQRWGDINGRNGTWFCGAYWQNGFHEDGLSSGLRVAESLCAARQMAA